MSVIHILNKATPAKPGAGIPFYDNINYIFGDNGQGYDDGQGLWSVPTNKVPTFQIFVLDVYNTIDFFEFTGSGLYSVPFGSLTQTNVKINNINYICYESNDAFKLVPPVTPGVYYMRLRLTDGAFKQIELYSEKFAVKDCC